MYQHHHPPRLSSNRYARQTRALENPGRVWNRGTGRETVNFSAAARINQRLVTVKKEFAKR
jgi:hypothetical protein